MSSARQGIRKAEMVVHTLVLLAVQAQISALEWSAAPRRDIGQIQAPIGNAEFEIFPRSELTGVPPNTMLAGPGRPIGGLELAQGPGASVPFAPPSENLPPAAITPLPPNYREELPRSEPVTPVPAVPVPAAPPAAAVAVPVAPAPSAPAVAVQPAVPVAVAQPIPVIFATPTTGSSFIPAGAVVPVPAGAVPMATPAVPVPAAPGMQLAPTAGPAPGMPPTQPGFGFLSDAQAGFGTFQLQPRAGSAGAQPVPAARQPDPAPTPEPTIPPSRPPTRPSPPARDPLPPNPVPPPPTERPLEKLEIPPVPSGSDPLPDLEGPLPLPSIPQ